MTQIDNNYEERNTAYNRKINANFKKGGSVVYQSVELLIGSWVLSQTGVR